MLCCRSQDCQGFSKKMLALMKDPRKPSERKLSDKINGVKLEALKALDESMDRLKLVEANEQLASEVSKN